MEANEELEAYRAEERARHGARAREQRRMVAFRIRKGFHHLDHGQIILGRRRDAFRERGLRSDAFGQSGRLFVAGTRKARDLRGGMDKAVVEWLGPNKVLALDAPYVEGNRTMVSLIRIDLDMVFASPDAAAGAVRELVDQGALPCMPHFLVGDSAPQWFEHVTEDGEVQRTRHPRAFIRPHAWFILPAGSAVNCGANGRLEPKRLLAGVYRGIAKAMLPIGADPNANALLVRGKNPLSPYMTTLHLNDQSWPTLSEWAQWVDTRVGTEQLSRLAAEVQSDAGKGPSNVAFTTWQREAYAILREAHRAGDPAYGSGTDREALADILFNRMPLDGLDRDPGMNDEAASIVLGRVIGYASGSWNPERAEAKRTARGAMRHLTAGMNVRQARQASGRRSGALKAERALEAMVEAYARIKSEGRKLTKAAVSQAAGVARDTASRRWAEVVEKCDNRCLDKKPA